MLISIIINFTGRCCSIYPLNNDTNWKFLMKIITPSFSWNGMEFWSWTFYKTVNKFPFTTENTLIVEIVSKLRLTLVIVWPQKYKVFGPQISQRVWNQVIILSMTLSLHRHHTIVNIDHYIHDSSRRNYKTKSIKMVYNEITIMTH